MKLGQLSENSWEQIWSLPSISTEGTGKYVRNICPILLSNPVIACLFSVPPPAVDIWERMGYLSIECRSGLIVGGGTDSRLGGRQIVYANRLQIFAFDLFAPSASLIFDANLTGNVQFFAWEYVGEIE